MDMTHFWCARKKVNSAINYRPVICIRMNFGVEKLLFLIPL